MGGTGLVHQSLEPAMLRNKRTRRTASGGLIRGAIGEGAVGYFAAAGDAPRNPLIGPETYRIAALVSAGLLAMAVGLLVYLTDRDPSHTALIPAFAALAGSSLFGALGQWMPSFVHPFAFSLFTAATFPSRASAGYSACVAWWAVNVVFEVAQHPGINRSVAEAAAAVFGPSWVEHLLSSYVLRGTFDVGDLIAATAGAAGAASLLYVVHRLEVNHGR